MLLHIPKSFDANRPAVMVVFFHGHRATLTRDVLNRQQVAAQISASGVNAVLVAPQFAVAASDSSPGNLGEPGGFKRFIDEAGKQLTRLHGSAASGRTFDNMPVVIVAYSGGYLASAWSLHHGGVKNRVRGLVLLDALYGDLDKFADWIAGNKQAFFVSAYTSSTRRRNGELMKMLEERDVAYVTRNDAAQPARQRVLPGNRTRRQSHRLRDQRLGRQSDRGRAAEARRTGDGQPAPSHARPPAPLRCAEIAAVALARSARGR